MLNWFRALTSFGIGDTEQLRYCERLGDGRAISAIVPKGDPDGLALTFEHKITERDRKNGKLLPLAVDTLKHRGGKRQMTIVLTAEGAEALHRQLGKSLKRLRQRRRMRERLNMLMGIFMEIVSRERPPVYPLSGA